MNSLKKFIGSTWGQRATILVAIFIVMAIGEPKFFTGGNWASILLAIALYGIMACGMLFVVLIGGMDLSMGSMAACAGSYLAFQWVNGGYTTGSFVTGIIMGLVAGIVVGLLHGVLVAYLNLPAFVVTLATQYLIYGYVILYTKGSFVYPMRQDGFDPFYSLGERQVPGSDHAGLVLHRGGYHHRLRVEQDHLWPPAVCRGRQPPGGGICGYQHQARHHHCVCGLLGVRIPGRYASGVHEYGGGLYHSFRL